MTKEITVNQTVENRKTFIRSIPQQIAQHGILANGIFASSENLSSLITNAPVFSVDLETGNVTNQKQSGRCWMFAALNTFRHKVRQELKLKDFELSQNYTFFWDKYEKSNYFYENILKTAKEELDSRKVAFLLEKPQQDGGQWDMLVNLIQKYGIVPKTIMPETKSSSCSRELNFLLNKKLRKDAIVLRKLVELEASEEELCANKEKMLQEVYYLLATSLGTPPEVFDFEYRDDEKVYHLEQEITPLTFYDKYVGIDLGQYISVINAPTKDKPYNKIYTVEMLGNIVGSKEVRHLNVSMDIFKKLAIAQLNAGEAVWFGCDVGQSSDKRKGIMDTELYAFDEILGIDFKMSKAERLEYGESLMTHAMVLTGVDLIGNRSTKWKVENSWGEKVGTQGYFVMSDAWMDEYTYQIVIKKEFLDEALQAVTTQKAIVLNPWDPMGALA